MEYDYIIRELESNAIYGRCYKLSKLSVLVATLIKKGDEDVVEYLKGTPKLLKPYFKAISQAAKVLLEGNVVYSSKLKIK